MTITNPSKSASGPLTFRYDEGVSIEANISALYAGLRKRAKSSLQPSGTERVMKYMVGAVLSLLHNRHPSPFSHEATPGSEDFRIGNTIIHVHPAPEWPLLHQCFAEIDRRLRPLVISTRAGAAQVEALADEVGMLRRIEVLDITQFLVANMLKWTSFDGSQRRHTFEDLVIRYNTIIDACETDPSLKIEVA